MALKTAPENPLIPSPRPTNFFETAFGFSQVQQALYVAFRDLAYRANRVLPKDGTEPMEGPLVLGFFPTASLPAAADFEGAWVYDSTTNEVKWSDGATWNTIPTDASATLANHETRIDSLEAARYIQSIHTEVGTAATGTTLIPIDNTIPQQTEGDQYLSVSITPTNAANILYIDANMLLAHTVTGHMAVALFQDSTADALAVVATRLDTAGVMTTIPLRHRRVAGTTSPITFKIRAGSNSAGTTTFNGIGGANLYGGREASTLTVTEYSS